MLQEVIANDVVDDQLLLGTGALKGLVSLMLTSFSKGLVLCHCKKSVTVLFCYLIAPVFKGPLGLLHDVTLVDQGQGEFIISQGVFNSGPD